VREELLRTEGECEEKRGRLQQTGAGDEVLKGDEVRYLMSTSHILGDYILNLVSNLSQRFWSVRYCYQSGLCG